MPTPFDFIKQQALRVGSKALRDVVSGARQLPELGAATGILRNALSNVSELPVQVTETFRLGPAATSISRNAYGGSGLTRGGVIGTLERTPVPRPAPVPAWTRKAAESASGYPKLSPTSSVNPNYYPSSENPNYFPSSVNKNYFPDPSFRSIDPSSASQLRLDLRAPGGATAFSPYTTSKGALRPKGTKVGGQIYRPDIMVENRVVTVGPRGKGGKFTADVGTQDVIEQSLREAELPVPPSFVKAPAGQLEMFSPTGALYPANPKYFPAGVNLFNLNDPLQRLLLGSLGVGSIAAGISAMQSNDQTPMTNEEKNTPSATSTPSPVSTSSSALIDQLQAEQAGINMGRALAARLFTDESGRPLAESGNGGASEARNRRAATRAAVQQAVQQGGDPAAIVARAMEPRDPSSYKSAADYFAAEREYAQQQGMRGLMRQAGEQLAQRMQTEAQLGAWAEANPHLMYRLQQQQLANPAMNQQTGMNFEGEDVNAAMGSNPGNNAKGFGESQTEAELGNPKAYDIAQATAPLVQPTLENLPTAIQQRLQEEALRRRSAGLF